jgi:TPR repeat protein
VTLAHGHGGKDGVARGLARLETSCGAGSGYACAHLSEIEMRGQLAPDKKDTGKKLATASCEKLGGYPCLPAISALPAGADPALRTALAQRACDGGDAMGCYELGLDVANPDGPATPDQARATALYEKACAQDFGQACFNLAWQFLRGTGAPKDEQRGDGDAQKYCDLWGAEACYTVAAELAQKRGETADTAEALVTAGTRAANRGSAAGLNVMSHLLKDNKRWCAANDNVKDSCTFAGLLYAAWMDDAPEGSDDRAESRKQAVEALAKACGAGAQPACAAKARVEAQRP